MPPTPEIHTKNGAGPAIKRFTRQGVQLLDRLVWRILHWAGGDALSAGPAVRKIGLVLLVVIVLGIVLGVLHPSIPIGWHFGEGDPITIASVLGLIACASISHRIATLRGQGGLRVERANASSAAMWRLFTFAFAFLAADELLRIHETFDRYLHKLLGVRPVGITDHLDDLIVCLYGVAIVVVMLRNLPEVLRYVEAVWFCAGAFILAACSVALDFLASAKWYWRGILSDDLQIQLLIDVLDVIEEVCKVYAELCFIGALLVCLRIASTAAARDNN